MRDRSAPAGVRAVPGAVAAGLAAVLAAGLLAGCSGDDGAEAGPKSTVLVPGRPGEPNKTAVRGPSTPAPPTAAEIRFVEMMIPHHRQAVEMSELVPDRASSAQVRSMAERILGAQKAEIAAMRSWLARHGRPTTGPGGHDGHGGHASPSASPSAHAGMQGMATPEQMARLKAARGTEFDRLFLTLMITHHQGALAMVKDALDQGTDVFVQDLARDIESTQQAEINRMRALMPKD
mgnify:CR=1 FL=1